MDRHQAVAAAEGAGRANESAPVLDHSDESAADSGADAEDGHAREAAERTLSLVSTESSPTMLEQAKVGEGTIGGNDAPVAEKGSARGEIAKPESALSLACNSISGRDNAEAVPIMAAEALNRLKGGDSGNTATATAPVSSENAASVFDGALDGNDEDAEHKILAVGISARPGAEGLEDGAPAALVNASPAAPDGQAALLVGSDLELRVPGEGEPAPVAGSGSVVAPHGDVTSPESPQVGGRTGAGIDDRPSSARSEGAADTVSSITTLTALDNSAFSLGKASAEFAFSIRRIFALLIPGRPRSRRLLPTIAWQLYMGTAVLIGVWVVSDFLAWRLNKGGDTDRDTVVAATGLFAGVVATFWSVGAMLRLRRPPYPEMALLGGGTEGPEGGPPNGTAKPLTRDVPADASDDTKSGGPPKKKRGKPVHSEGVNRGEAEDGRNRAGDVAPDQQLKVLGVPGDLSVNGSIRVPDSESRRKRRQHGKHVHGTGRGGKRKGGR